MITRLMPERVLDKNRHMKTDSGATMFVCYSSELCSFVCRFNKTKGASMSIEKDWVVVGNIYEDAVKFGIEKTDELPICWEIE